MKLLGSSTPINPAKHKLPMCIGLINITLQSFFFFFSKSHKLIKVSYSHFISLEVSFVHNDLIFFFLFDVKLVFLLLLLLLPLLLLLLQSNVNREANPKCMPVESLISAGIGRNSPKGAKHSKIGRILI